MLDIQRLTAAAGAACVSPWYSTTYVGRPAVAGTVPIILVGIPPTSSCLCVGWGGNSPSVTAIIRESVSFLPFNDGDFSAFQADFGQVLLAVLQEIFFFAAVGKVVINPAKASLQAFIPRGVLFQNAAEFDFSVVYFVFHVSNVADSQKIARIIFNFFQAPLDGV